MTTRKSTRHILRCTYEGCTAEIFRSDQDDEGWRETRDGDWLCRQHAEQLGYVPGEDDDEERDDETPDDDEREDVKPQEPVPVVPVGQNTVREQRVIDFLADDTRWHEAEYVSTWYLTSTKAARAGSPR